jgi:quinol monooxygenase YgiN
MIEARPGEAESVARILQDLAEPTMAEPGVKLFLPYRSPTDPGQFFIFELYVDEAAWGAHQGTEHFTAAAKVLLPRLARRERIPFVPF